MRPIITKCILLLATMSFSQLNAAVLPVPFEINKGQARPEYGYMLRGQGYTISLSATHVDWVSRESHVHAVLEGSSAVASGEPELPLPGVVNYLRGRNPSAWLFDIPTYERVRYRDVYPGIDAIYYGKEGRPEVDFQVAPGQDPNQIRIRYEGVRSLRVDRHGNLELKTPGGTFRQQRPFLYQEVSGVRREVAGGYRIAAGSVRFQVGRYDHSLPLVIDPPLTWSSYVGGSNAEQALAVATDGAGNTYTAGAVTSEAGDADCFVSKLNASATTPLFTTVIGGTLGNDAANAIVLDSVGNIYIAGQTDADDFPVYGSKQNLAGLGVDAFLLKLDPSGKLLYATYIGGSSNDIAYALGVDASNNVYVAGGTQSSDFPAAGSPYQRASGGGIDAFLALFTPDGNLFYSTYLGGIGDDIARGVAVDLSYNVYLTGTTTSTNFPVTAKALQARNAGGVDAFVTKLAPVGAPVYSTYLGGSGDEAASGIAVDSAGSAYVVGDTSSTNFPVLNAYQARNAGNRDIFVVQLAADGTRLAFSTYVGGSGKDTASAVAIDSTGMVFVAGRTESKDFPVSDAVQQSAKGASDAVVLGLNAGGQTLRFSTYLGGSGDESVTAMRLDCAAGLLVAGGTTSNDFPVVNGAAQPRVPVGSMSGFVARLGVVTQPAAIQPGGVQNGATFLPTAVAPGSVLTVKGTNLGNAIASAPSYPLPMSLGGTSVKVNGNAVPLYSASPGQVNAQVPYELSPGSASVSVSACGGPSGSATFQVQAAAPYILLGGNGAPLIQNPDYGLNSADKPAHAGETVTVYMIGLGALDNPVPTGAAAPLNPLSRAKAPSTAKIGGQGAQILFLGLTPTYVGLAQANVVVPALSAGRYDLSISVGGVTSNTASIYVQ